MKVYEFKIQSKDGASDANAFHTLEVESPLSLELSYVMDLIKNGFFFDD